MKSAICTKCGASYYGWALRYAHNQVCQKCGAHLELQNHDEATRRDGSKLPELSPQTDDSPTHATDRS
jgi:transcription initiation factor IIE alpha subunit